MDLDNFKWVNDEYGHAVGDKVLQKLGKRLLSSLRESDVVARLGGDEFVIILENIRSKEDVRRIAKKLLENISRPIRVENHAITVTASIGINIADDRNLPYVDLLKKSDFAMYQVKDSGKNDFRFYTSENQV
jgi:diguanylate cyclase (GGDEF)-like protein